MTGFLEVWSGIWRIPKEFETYSTGAKAPANWIEGTYPEGEAEYPVNDVSYEDAIECEKSEVMSTKAILDYKRRAKEAKKNLLF